MKEAFQEFIKSTVAVIIVLGVVLFTIGAANGISIGSTFSVQLTNEYWKIAMAGVGLVLIVFGLYRFVRDPNQSQTTISTAAKTSVGINEPIRHRLKSEKGEQDARVEINFVNLSKRTIECIWIDYEGNEDQKIRRKLSPNQSHNERTFVTHPWLIRDMSSNEQLLVVLPRSSNQAVTIEIADAA